MRVVIEDDYLAELYKHGKPKGKPRFNSEIERGFIKRVTQFEQAPNTIALRALKSLHLEKLAGNLEGKFSIRVNRAFRIIFRIVSEDSDVKIEIIHIEELSNHYS